MNKRVLLEYDQVEGRLYCIAGGARTEMVRLRPQQRRMVAHMTARNRAASTCAAMCTYDELRKAIWGEEDGCQPHTEQEINRLVWELRRAIGASTQESPFETVRGVGYRLHTPPAPAGGTH
ncbi:MAG: helix-turn-helix domain-containing protein [Chloroflexi bacterium]|nr:helix-turn-helix domain-containing protein [Chloroflexota bacterium]